MTVCQSNFIFKIRSVLDLDHAPRVLTFHLSSIIFYFSWMLPPGHFTGTKFQHAEKKYIVVHQHKCSLCIFPLRNWKNIYPNNQQSKDSSCSIYPPFLFHFYGAPLLSFTIIMPQINYFYNLNLLLPSSNPWSNKQPEWYMQLNNCIMIFVV